MIKKLLITFIATYVISSSVESSLPCNFISTINITDGYENENGSFVYKNDVYPRSEYKKFNFIEDLDGECTRVEPHIRGCICNLKPCIRFCCDDEENCEKIDKLIITNEEYNEEVIDLNDNKYAVLAGRPCHILITLEPEEYENDAWRFMKNGSIINNEIEYTSEDYCLMVSNNSQASVNLCLYIPKGPVPSKLYPIGMLISIPFLIITFCVYAFIPELRNLHGKCLMCYIFALLMVYIVLTIGQTEAFGIGLGKINCYFVGCLIYFFVMLMFFWTNVTCYDIWRVASQNILNSSFSKDSKLFVKYCIYAFGFPFLITTILILIDQNELLPFELLPLIGIYRCFIENRSFYLYTPISIIMLINIVFFVDTAIKVWKIKTVSSEDDSENRKKHIKRRLFVYLRLFIVMGILWCMEIISHLYNEKHWIFKISDFLNCIQGVWIFLVCVCDVRTRRLITKRLSAMKNQ